MKFQGKEIKAIIFDMDGTLIDSTGIWGEIDRVFFARRGINEVPKEYSEMIVHTGLELGAKMTIEKYGFYNDTPEGIIKEWKDSSIDQYENHVPLKPFVKEFLDYIKSNFDVHITLATANDKNLYEPCLKRLGIYDYFETIVDVDMIKEGKTSPKIFDSIVEKYNIKREETIVVEDSLAGLKTASTYGYLTIGVDDLSSIAQEEGKKSYSNVYVYSFKELLEKFEK